MTDRTLTGNDLDLTVTPAQFEFLQRLEVLNISASAISSAAIDACESVEMLSGASFCIKSESSIATESISHNSHTVAIAVGVVAAVVVLLLLGWGLYTRNKRRRAGNEDDLATDSSIGTNDKTTFSRDPNLVRLRLATSFLQDVKWLGNGDVSTARLVKLQDNRHVVAKRLKAENITPEQVDTFVKEIKLAARLSHPRIVALVGVAWTNETDIQALSEYVNNGDLRQYIRGGAPARGWYQTKKIIAIGIIDALAYIHSFIPPVVHGNLKSRNVLLSEALTAKLKNIRDTPDTDMIQAPEVLTGNHAYDRRSDIFSFGLLLSELESLSLPFEDETDPEGLLLKKVEVRQNIVAGKLRPRLSKECPLQLRSLIEKCLDNNPANRPMAAEISYRLYILQ